MAFKVPYILLADSVQSVGNGKHNILGVFDRIHIATLPTVYQGFAVVALVVAETEDVLGQHKVAVRFVRPNLQTVAETGGPMRFAPDGGPWALGANRIVVALGGVPFKEYGRHWVVLVIDDVEVARHPLVAAPVPAPTPKA